MPERVALKQLTASDLTFFASQFRRLKVGNQKSINLNADPFSSKLYPGLAGAGLGADIEIRVSVAILGPKKADHRYEVTRSITKKPAYKNWRLNGAAVLDPPNEAGRFDVLVPGDIALMRPLRNALLSERRTDSLMLVMAAARRGWVSVGSDRRA